MPNDVQNAPAVQTAAPVMAFTARDEFDLALRQAKVYASSTLVPAQYQGMDNLPNCLIALNMAKRIGMDVLQCMQSLYVVHGRPGWSGQFLIASFNQCGRFSAMRFEWRGEQGKKDWGCRAWAIEKSTGERIEGPWVTWAMVEAEGWASKNGSKWKTMPELMFHYRAAAFMVRTHAPEIAMGLQTTEEIGDVIDVTPTGAEVPNGDALSRAKAAVSEALHQVEPPTFAEVAALINEAKDGDSHNLAVDMIRQVPDEVQRNELTKLAKDKRDALMGEDVPQ